MLGEGREALESALRTAWNAGELRLCATQLLESYGPEILGFLAAAMRDREEAGDVFSQFSEDLWVGLGAFRGHCSFRTWAYTLARNAAHRHRRDPLRRRRVAISECPELSELEARVRSATVSYLRTDVKDRVTRLRDALEPDDRMLLVLRIDRGMAWSEMAEVMLEGEDREKDGPHDEADRARKAASLRKRFERLKERLRALAQADASGAQSSG